MRIQRNSLQKLSLPNLDFEKAFDRVSHEWLIFVLKAFGFGTSIINLVSACLSDNLSKVILPNGGFSEGFPILSGVRQVDCISPLLFVLSIDPIIRAILNSDKIRVHSIPIHHNSSFKCDALIKPFFTKVIAFADDITLIGSKNDLKEALELFELYCLVSGAKLNVNKCSFSLYSSNLSSQSSFSMPHQICEIKYASKFVYLGIPFNEKWC